LSVRPLPGEAEGLEASAIREKGRMNLHKNARLTPGGRERIIELVASGQTPQAASQAVGVCPRPVRKWGKRYVQEGVAGLLDRNPRPPSSVLADTPADHRRYRGIAR
jgi:hypothetical protein